MKKIYLVHCKTKKRELVKYNPKTIKYNNCYEYGITNIDDFGFSTKSKSGNGLTGSDISQVHENNESWEVSVSRDKNLFKKYNNNETLESRLSDYMLQRDSLNIESEIMKSEIHYKQKIKKNNLKIQKIKNVENKRNTVKLLY